MKILSQAMDHLLCCTRGRLRLKHVGAAWAMPREITFQKEHQMESLSFQPHTIIEPFRVKTVTPIHMTSQEQRTATLAAANYNLFLLRAEDVLIDLLTARFALL